jgi:hypothetical protein
MEVFNLGVYFFDLVQEEIKFGVSHRRVVVSGLDQK